MPGEYDWGTHWEPGFSWEWARTEKSSQYRFITAPETRFVPYFGAQPDGKPFNLRIELPGGAAETQRVDRSSTAAARAHGMSGNARIVELEVNDGRGGRGTHFVITKLRVIDGTDTQWELEDQLLRLRKRFDGARHDHRKKLSAKLAKARKQREANPGGKILRELRPDELLGGEIVIVNQIWHADTAQLEVIFGYKKSGGFWIESKNVKPQPYTKQAPPPRERGVSYSVGMGARYVVDARGKIVDETVYPPEIIGQTRAYLPWASAQPTPTPAKIRSSKLRYYRTCGDPVCSDDGYRGPYPGVPPCKKQREGHGCLSEGETCDLGNNCNMFLVCSETDPAQRCAR